MKIYEIQTELKANPGGVWSSHKIMARSFKEALRKANKIASEKGPRLLVKSIIFIDEVEN